MIDDVQVQRLAGELALEARMLRGACPVEVTSGRVDLLQPDDGTTSWPANSPRDGATPPETPPATSTP